VVESKECILTEFVLGKLRLFTLIQVLRNTDLPYDILVGRDIICHGQEVQFAKESGLKLTAVEQVGFSVTDIDPDQEQMSNLLKCYEECFAEDLSKIGRCKTTTMDIKVSTTNVILERRYQMR